MRHTEEWKNLFSGDYYMNSRPVYVDKSCKGLMNEIDKLVRLLGGKAYETKKKLDYYRYDRWPELINEVLGDYDKTQSELYMLHRENGYYFLTYYNHARLVDVRAADDGLKKDEYWEQVFIDGNPDPALHCYCHVWSREYMGAAQRYFHYPIQFFDRIFHYLPKDDYPCYVFDLIADYKNRYISENPRFVLWYYDKDDSREELAAVPYKGE